MSDQAERLRRLIRDQRRMTGSHRRTRLIAVASGKGGVGKSNVVLNLALALHTMGESVALLDGDVGFSNLDILLGIKPEHTLQDVLEGRVHLIAAFARGPHDIAVLSGGSGTPLSHVGSTEYARRLAEELRTLDGRFDRVYMDLGAGFGSQVGEMIALCDEMLIVSTPEPTALADAYALVKMVILNGDAPIMHLVMNRARSVGEASEAANRFIVVAQSFLRAKIDLLGYVLEDAAVIRAVRKQAPFLLNEPRSLAARCIHQLAKNAVSGDPAEPSPRHGIQAFFERFMAR